MQSFFIGVVLATVVLGVFLLAYTLADGDASGGTAVEARPTATPTVALAVAPTTRPAGSATPSSSVTAVAGASTTPTATPVNGTPQPNRADCNLIRGTDYLSDAERSYFNANCLGTALAPTPGLSTSGSNVGTGVQSSGGQSSGGQSSASSPPPPPPTPTVPPRNPQQVAFENLISSSISEAEVVMVGLASPKAVDSVWRNEISAHIAEVQRLVGVASVTPPPSCLVVPYQTLRSAGIDLSIGAGLASSGVDANDVNLMRLAQQRIGAGHAGLVSTLSVVSAADC